ncbi:MAG TPA: galactokinase [Gemmatimonadales bacterium]|nr:galactokinase [Gemmatimonadales bacterium]
MTSRATRRAPLAAAATAELRHAFATAFPRVMPTRLARAPGRVNLIGEHVDYCGLSVFPMAIQREVRVVFRPRTDGLVRAHNTIPQFGPREFSLAAEPPPEPPGDWGNYLKAAAQGLVRHYGITRGLDAVVWSDLPLASGLSSSAALVVATALALLDANDVEIDRAALMTLLPEAERYVGTRGGGMDQAISLGAVQGTASRVDFNPVRVTPIKVPRGWRFVIAWSLAHAEKSGPAKAAYNERTRECATALERLAAVLREPRPASYSDLLARSDSAEWLRAARTVLDDVLLKRFRHVVSEGARVHMAQAAMEQADLAAFGELMNASHQSLANDYEVSTPALDELVRIARDAGAAGARLTGAGFGGCIVALCDAERERAVLAALASEFYAPRGVTKLSDCLFVAQPGGAASVGAFA